MVTKAYLVPLERAAIAPVVGSVDLTVTVFVVNEASKSGVVSISAATSLRSIISDFWGDYDSSEEARLNTDWVQIVPDGDVYLNAGSDPKSTTVDITPLATDILVAAGEAVRLP